MSCDKYNVTEWLRTLIHLNQLHDLRDVKLSVLEVTHSRNRHQVITKKGDPLSVLKKKNSLKKLCRHTGLHIENLLTPHSYTSPVATTTI